MFFVLRPSAAPSFHCHPRHHGRVKHRVGKCHRFHPLHPHVLVDFDDDVDNHHYARWVPRRRCALTAAKTNDAKMGDEASRATPSATPQEITDSGKESTSCEMKTSEGSPAKNDSPSLTKQTITTRHHTSQLGNTVIERTPVHRRETEEEATISLDVSGFTVDQLQVRLEEEPSASGRPARPILIVSGERQNTLGDHFKIHRRFLLDRENLDSNIKDIAISANFSNDGVLTIRVPKKKKVPEKEPEKISRTIVVQQQVANSKDEPKASEKESDKTEGTPSN
jgi:HSP20 family molecular chaperone IbpA